MNPEVVPGRMTMLVTLFLVLINIHNTIQTNSPKVTYIYYIKGGLKILWLPLECMEYEKQTILLEHPQPHDSNLRILFTTAKCHIEIIMYYILG